MRLVLLGHPVSHSLSPVFQNAAIRAAGLNALYTALDVFPADLARTVAELRAEGVAGNVTVPHKRAVMALCDVVSPVAKRTGAVNTFWVEDGALHGDNTDVAGFDAAVRVLLGRAPERERVALFGAGGAAAAVLAAVESWPSSRVTLVNRTGERGRILADAFSHFAVAAESTSAALDGATLVVNATSVGMAKGESPVDSVLLPAGCAVLDLVYRPGETDLVREARTHGHAAADGREMLLEQGVRAFMQWFDCAPNKMVMRQALEGAMLGG